VARITGSLSANARIQRLRLHAGWNLVSVAVTAADLLGQIQHFNDGHDLDPLLHAAYRGRPLTGNYTSLEPGETVAAGSILWLHARTNQVIAVRGDYLPPTAPSISAGGGFVSGLGLEVWPVQLPPGVSIWKFDALGGGWQVGLPGDLAPLSNIARQIAPGEAIYVHGAEAIELSIPRPERQVTYFHPDHLASSSVVTDSAGEIVEETAYHPFGVPRHQSRPGGMDPSYGFTQKERDQESRLHYFEARYLASPLARFLSFDPLVQRIEALAGGELKNLLLQPGKLNPFAYALNNPVRYNDPDGRDPRPRPTERKPEVPEPELTIRIGPAAKGTKEISAFAFHIEQQPARTTSGHTGGRNARSAPPDIHITRNSDKASTDLAMKFRTGSPIKSAVLIVSSKEGEYRIHMRDVLIDSVSVSHDSMDGKLVETFKLNAGAVQFGDPEPPAPNRESPRWWTVEPRTNQ
ncbi:MAG TPA: RHS repeat-associated core domain-containing protein, partial [Verrucomicrobiae bacterium]|nr:RHS repeat-associated core domain-containing protein [Verrucomicrobiae bacterium]